LLSLNKVSQGLSLQQQKQWSSGGVLNSRSDGRGFDLRPKLDEIGVKAMLMIAGARSTSLMLHVIVNYAIVCWEVKNKQMQKTNSF